MVAIPWLLPLVFLCLLGLPAATAHPSSRLWLGYGCGCVFVCVFVCVCVYVTGHKGIGRSLTKLAIAIAIAIAFVFVNVFVFVFVSVLVAVDLAVAVAARACHNGFIVAGRGMGGTTRLRCLDRLQPIGCVVEHRFAGLFRADRRRTR